MRVFDPETRARSDEFVDGSRFTDAVALHDFDHRLRRTLMPALQSLEVCLRTKIAYYLGKHGALAHLDLEANGLDRQRCDLWLEKEGASEYQIWRDDYDALQRKSGREDYVSHFITKYDGTVPVWAAVEFMTMGCLIRLYRMMLPKDASRIARECGVKHQDILAGWLKALNVLRNHCAHNSRLWNRSTTYPPGRINVRMVDEDLHHLTSANADPHKLYFLVAILAYLLRRTDPKNRFANDLRTTLKKFPCVLGMTPETSMGFVQSWGEQRLWAV